jgi:hypothetical protein
VRGKGIPLDTHPARTANQVSALTREQHFPAAQSGSHKLGTRATLLSEGPPTRCMNSRVDSGELFDVGVVVDGDADFDVSVEGACVVDEGADFDGGDVS